MKQWQFQILEKQKHQKFAKKAKRAGLLVENLNKIEGLSLLVLNVFNKRADEFLYIE